MLYLAKISWCLSLTFIPTCVVIWTFSGTSAANDTSVVNSIGATNISGRELDKKQGNLEAKQLGRATTVDGLVTTGQGALKKPSGMFFLTKAMCYIYMFTRLKVCLGKIAPQGLNTNQNLCKVEAP